MKGLYFRYIVILSALFVMLQAPSFAQGFLHADGTKIVDGNNNNFIIRSIGTGNWMIQEGYMMQSGGFAATQHEFRNKLIEAIGLEKTNEFYDSWLTNHFQKADVDSMAAWGFNSVRVAMHYLWFTPPIEEEPIPGEITWIDRGFVMLDNLLDWCEANQMYLILDLHGAPGGQGANADISDYDPSKPSLWESDLNKDKTVALWGKLAERYSNEPWIGGYDLLNEVNWAFPEGNNSQLRSLYGRITDAIREVDQNHIIYIEGNWFANDFSGLTPAWDDNMVYSFHKYWSYNYENSLDWVTGLREQTNCPIWLGETGENSNTWFTNLVALSEENNIGWSWWPVKKGGINNVLKVEINEDYQQLMKVWGNDGTVSSDFAYNAVMQFSDDHRIENCTVQYDVIDALTRQPYTTETEAFKKHSSGETIFAVDYDLGRNNYAYFDQDTADYHLDTDHFQAWNTGWNYRSDGVDIQNCEDNDLTNGYHVAWINKGEWLQYTINSQEYGAYDLVMRTAGQSDGAFHVEVNGNIASEILTIPATGDWDKWTSTTFENILLPKGEAKVRIVFDKPDVNFNYFVFQNPNSPDAVSFDMITAVTPVIESEVIIQLNKAITEGWESTGVDDFQLIANNRQIAIASIVFPEDNSQVIRVLSETDLFHDDNIRITYKGSALKSGMQELEKFTALSVENNFYQHYAIPGKIEIEDNFYNKGFNYEDCADDGGGLNSSHANDGDYMDYLINVEKAGTYRMNIRVATLYDDAEVLVMNSFEDRMIANKVIRVEKTGGWQAWKTQTVNMELPEGKLVLRIYSRKGEYNLNWMSFELLTEALVKPLKEQFEVYPNPVYDSLYVNFFNSGTKSLSLFNMNGTKILETQTNEFNFLIDTGKYPQGNYILQLKGERFNESLKIQILK